LSEQGSKLDEKESEFPEKVERLRWVDQGRGFIIFMLVLTLAFPPDEWKPEGSIMFFLFGHPGPFDTYMTVFDIGAAAFIFVIGLIFSISFRKRLEKQGLIAAIKYVVIRYGLLLVLGYIVVAVGGRFSYYDARLPGVLILMWDVIPTLGLVGFVTLPFVLIKRYDVRMIIGYLWILFYQILMITTPLKLYAQLSVHGGIFGTIFGYSGIMIIATALGDYLFRSKIEDKIKYKNMALFGAINLVAGNLLSFITGWEASKRQVSFSHCAISIAVCVLGLLIVVYLDKVKNMELGFFQAYGRNPFLTYLIAETPIFLLDNTIGVDLGLGWPGNLLVTAIVLTYTTFTVLYLYMRKKIISTEKTTIIFIIIAIILAILLIFLGVI
jgi:hypothetical protein